MTPVVPVGEAPVAPIGCGVTGEMAAGEGSGAPGKSAKSALCQEDCIDAEGVAGDSIPSSLVGDGGF